MEKLFKTDKYGCIIILVGGTVAVVAVLLAISWLLAWAMEFIP